MKELGVEELGAAARKTSHRRARPLRRMAVSASMARRTLVSSVRRLFRRRKTRDMRGNDAHPSGEKLEEHMDSDCILSAHHSTSDGLTLLTHGSKHYQLLGGIASVRLYDFDILIDTHSLSSRPLQESPKTPEKKGRRNSKQRGRSDVVSGHSHRKDIDPSALSSLFRLPISYSKSSKDQGLHGHVLPDAKIVLYAARDLPLDDLRMELSRVLSARLPPSRDDNKSDILLDHLLSALSRERLPSSALSPSLSHIKCGKSLEFKRSDCGDVEGEPSACRITLSEGGGEQLSQVRSSELSFALFDLFLGENAVSEKARRMATLQLMRIHDRNARNAISLHTKD